MEWLEDVVRRIKADSEIGDDVVPDLSPELVYALYLQARKDRLALLYGLRISLSEQVRLRSEVSAYQMLFYEDPTATRH